MDLQGFEFKEDIKRLYTIKVPHGWYGFSAKSFTLEKRSQRNISSRVMAEDKPVIQGRRFRRNNSKEKHYVIRWEQILICLVFSGAWWRVGRSGKRKGRFAARFAEALMMDAASRTEVALRHSGAEFRLLFAQRPFHFVLSLASEFNGHPSTFWKESTAAPRHLLY